MGDLPVLGRIVRYQEGPAAADARSAVIIATQTAQLPNTVGLPAPSSPQHVHLSVHHPRGSGPAWENVLDVPYSPDGAPDAWCWLTAV